jgi:hypothetical protein
VAIENWIEASGIINTDNEILVQVTSGLFFKSMLLAVWEIHVANQDLLVLADLNSSKDQDQSLASIPTLQYALHKREAHQIKPKCLEYINAISSCPLDDSETIIGDTPKIIWRSLEAIGCFIRANAIARHASSLPPPLSKDVRR